MSPKIFILSVLAILVCNIPGMLSEQEGITEAPLKKELVGCFKALTIGKHVGRVVSIEDCLKKCYEYSSPYAGVALGVYCSCGRDLSKYTKGSSCTKKCQSKEENCGGIGLSSVYKVPELPGYYLRKVEPGQRFARIGCYQVEYPRKMTNFVAKVSSVKRCLEKCINYKYFAIEVGLECYCGNDYPRVKSDQCTKKCVSGTICGGDKALSVFQILLDL